MLKIYKASAGSGKTYRLALEYIKLLLGTKGDDGRYRLNRNPRDAHRQILAITFTNKATGEMKRRILHELARLGGCEPGWDGRGSSYEADLLAEMRCSPADLRKAASSALKALVMDYNFFNISTIDSFFQVVLRSFAREARVMGDYSVNLDDKEALRLGVSDMLVRLNHGEESQSGEGLTGWLLDYMHSRMTKGKAFNIFNREARVRSDLVRFIAEISDENFHTHYDTLMAYLRRDDNPVARFNSALRKLEKDLGAAMRRSARECLAMIDANAPGKVTALAVTMLTKFAEGLHDDKTFVSKTFIKALEEPGALFKKNMATDSVASQISATATRLLDLNGRLAAVSATLDSLYILGIVERVYACIDEIHRAGNTIQLSDTNALLRRIIGDDDAPFIYERLGMSLNHFLIDEFQDTSLMQWQNLTPLVDESHSRDNDNLIIGDEKQCIYRFRNSDPTLLKDRVERQFDRVEITGTSADGNTNWRSSADVVRFNNTFFTHAPLAPDNAAVYANVVQKVAPGNTSRRGYVSIRAISAANKRDYAEAALARMSAEIMRQLDSGRSPGDIAVLTRRSTEARDVIECLMRLAETTGGHRFTVISDDSLRVASSPVVRGIITRLRFLASADVATSSRALTPRRFSALFNSFEQELSLRMEQLAAGGSPTDCDTLAGDVLRQVVSRLKSDADCDPDHGMTSHSADGADTILATDLTMIIERMLSAMPAAMRDEQAMYITAFMDLVGEYADSGPNDVRSFLKWWDMNGNNARISSPESSDAIRVMTIHKAKGLEFPCVHIPFCTWEMTTLKGAKWFDPWDYDGIDPQIIPPLIPLEAGKALALSPYAPQLREYEAQTGLDELNVLYVALTRAIDELIVSVDENPPESAVSSLMLTTLRAMTSISPDAIMAPVTFDAETATYTAGAPGAPSAAKADTPPKALEPTQVSPMPPYYVLDRSDLWRDTSVELPDHYEDGDARTRGTILHAALEEIRSVADIDRSVRRLVMAGVLPRDQEQPTAALLHRELSRPEVAEWFDGSSRVMSERSIYIGRDPDDGTALTRRPDRIVRTAGGTVDVIDYKTGHLPDDEADLRNLMARYCRQVSAYAGYLRRALPEPVSPVRGFIWHLDSSQIIRVC